MLSGELRFYLARIEYTRLSSSLYALVVNQAGGRVRKIQRLAFSRGARVLGSPSWIRRVLRRRVATRKREQLHEDKGEEGQSLCTVETDGRWDEERGTGIGLLYT